MIDVKELRIGNYVWCGYNCTYAKIEVIVPNKSSLMLFNKHVFGVKVDTLKPFVNLIDFDSLDPIELTPEILEKCCFEYIGHSSLYHIFGMDIKVEDYGFYFEYGSIMRQRLKYLHQLQNLYFDLTDYELTIY